MTRSINRLNEEISRWSFEIKFKSNSLWTIAFTNPTAGPWKTIKASSLIDGTNGEVYRFIQKENRPDIIMYNDKLRIIIIFEAKDILSNLRKKKQAQKSADVVIKLGHILHYKKDNFFWKGRENYAVLLGLLWGSTNNREEDSSKNKLYDQYHDLIKKAIYVDSDIIVGIESLYKDEKLTCFIECKVYNPIKKTLADSIYNTLKK